MCNCSNTTIEIYSRIVSRATREEPAEWLEWGVCSKCGKFFDISDIPSDAKIIEGDNELTIRGTPHEFYD